MTSRLIDRLTFAANLPVGIHSADWYLTAALGYGNVLAADGVGAMLCWTFTIAATVVIACSAWLLVRPGRAAILLLRLGAVVLVAGNLDLMRQAIWWMMDDGRSYARFAWQGAAWLGWLALNLSLPPHAGMARHQPRPRGTG